MLTEETLRTVVWAFVSVFGIAAFTGYAFARLIITKRGMFERRDHDHSNVHLVR